MSKSPISILQEYFMANYRQLPNYTIEEVSIPGPRRFCCTVICGSEGLSASDYGTNKKEAKHNCALKALNLFNLNIKENFDSLLLDKNNYKANNKPEDVESVLRPPSPSSLPSWPQMKFVNYVGKLSDFVVSLKVDYPQYSTTMVYLENQMKFVTTCQVREYKTEGAGYNKKQSKQTAAKRMLEQLEGLNNSDPFRLYRYRDATTDTEIKKSMEKAIEKFSSIYVSNTCSTAMSSGLQKTQDIPPNEAVMVKKYNLEECKNILKGSKFESIIIVVMTNPFIVAVNRKNTVLTFLGTGPTKEAAELEAFNHAVDMIANGCFLLH